MGVQIKIENELMESIGFRQEVSYETQYELNDEATTYIETRIENTFWVRGETRLFSYSSEYFFADCNAWGTNRALFEAEGLLELEHEFV